MKVLVWRVALLLAAIAVWEVVAAPLNPVLYVRPSTLPGALARMWRVPELPPLTSHVWLTLEGIGAAGSIANSL